MPDSTNSFNDQPSDTQDQNFFLKRSLQRGETIGHYRLLQMLGGGGQGEVWLADQLEPIRRQVAVKFLRTGNLSPSQVARFEVERQALAMMEHPHIATIFDMGIDDQIGPYFVMEFCRGQPLTAFCDSHKLSIQDRLELFSQVCGAVQHAHQKSIIHRDLKPSNILVIETDRGPQVKVIDFGLAKAAQSQLRLTDRSLFTEVGQLVGTYKYMSPEQASGSTLDLDTRTDIYSLGVILYELLTGSTPMDDQTLRGKALDEVVRMIRESDPMLPSRRLSDSHDSLASISESRKADPKRLPLSVRGDLDWIVMKALEKDRSRRYQSANHFMEDVQRHLHGEPVSAAPPSRTYRWRKVLWRYRLTSAISALFLLCLLGGTVGTTIGFFRSQKMQKLAEQRLVEVSAAKEAESNQRQEAQQQREKAEAAEKLAQEKLELSEEMLNFFLNDLLSQASSINQQEQNQKANPNITVIEALNRAHELIDQRFEKRPLLQARIRNLIGSVYHHLSDYDSSIAQLSKAAKIYEQELGKDHEDYLEIMHNIAITMGDAGRVKECIEGLEQLYKSQPVGPESKFTLKVQNDLAVAYAMAGDYKRSCELTEKTLRNHLDTLGPRDQQTLTVRNNLAVMYGMSFQYDRAVQHLEDIVAIETEVSGDESRHVLLAKRNLATGYRQMGRLDDAKRTMEQVLEAQRRTMTPEHTDIAMTLNRLAAVVNLMKDYAKERELLEEALAIQTKQLVPENHELLHTRSSLALLKLEEGDVDGAFKDLSAVYSVQKQALTRQHPDTQSTMMNIGVLYYKRKAFRESVAALKQVVDLMTQTQPDSWLLAIARIRLGRSYAAVEEYRLAEAELLAGYNRLIEQDEAIPFSHKHFIKEAAADLAQLYEKTGQKDEAEKWR